MIVKKFCGLIALFGLLSSDLVAQVGINTITPDTSASLDIRSKPTGSGLLIPKLTEAQRLAIPSPAKGLMVYDITANLFYMNLNAGSSSWYAINPWIGTGSSTVAGPAYTAPVITNVGIGTTTPAAKLDVVGEIHSSDSVTAPRVNTNTLAVPGFANNALVPSGGIIMWSGTTAPAGWAICDGTNGTPDLRGRFVVGYSSASAATPVAAPADGITTNYGAVGNTGGETGHSLTKAELAKHQHVIGNGTDGSSISNPGDHNHSYTARDGGGHDTGNAVANLGYQTYTTGGAGNHIHTGNTGDGTSDGVNGSVHENRPPYYVLAYIMKLP